MNCIPIPSTFTLDYYIQQKEQQKTDAELADEFYISYVTFQNWKKRLGWKVGEGRKYNGRKRLPLTDRIIKMYQQGLTNIEIANTLNITDATVCNHLYKYSNLPKRGAKNENPS